MVDATLVFPGSHVSDRRKVVGRLRTCLLNAATTTAVSLLGTLISMRKRECRSTNVAISCSFRQPADRLPNDQESPGLPLPPNASAPLHPNLGLRLMT